MFDMIRKISAATAVALLMMPAAIVSAQMPEFQMPTMGPGITPIPVVTPAGTQTVVTPAPTTAITPAPAAPIVVDLVIFAGQSNMSGGGGNAKAAPAVAAGTGYEFRTGGCPAGLYPVSEPFGVYSGGKLADPPGVKRGSLVSSFMNSYYGASHVPVLGFSASRGGTSIGFWQSAEVQNELSGKFDQIRSWCSANNVTIRRKYAVWLQGETDAIGNMETATYESGLKNVFNRLFAKGLERVFVIPIGKYVGLPGSYDKVRAAQIDICRSDPRFVLGSDGLASLSDKYLADGCHYNQSALNTVGAQCGSMAGRMSGM